MDGAKLGLIGGIAGLVLGLIGGIIGTYFSIKNTKGAKEKSFMIKYTVIGWIIMSFFLILFILLPNPYKHLLWIPYSIMLPLGIYYGNRKMNKIRQDEL